MVPLNHIFRKGTRVCKKQTMKHFKHIDNVRWFEKTSRIRDSNSNNKNIQPGYRYGIWTRKTAMPITKSEKRQITEKIELSKQTRIRML